jgi:hypothetical protein
MNSIENKTQLLGRMRLLRQSGGSPFIDEYQERKQEEAKR